MEIIDRCLIEIDSCGKWHNSKNSAQKTVDVKEIGVIVSTRNKTANGRGRGKSLMRHHALMYCLFHKNRTRPLIGCMDQLEVEDGSSVLYSFMKRWLILLKYLKEQ